MNEAGYKAIVEEAGAQWIGIGVIKGQNTIIFSARQGSDPIMLYSFALKNVNDVRMAVKAQRDREEMTQVVGI